MSEINIDSVSREFEGHLKIEGNYRIIFSGKFGIGKTFFLNSFFDKKADEYNKVIISPVNYVVNSNEDIFELIKADIVQYLFFNNKIAIPFSEENKLQDLAFFAYEKPQHFLKFITSAFKKVNPLFEIGNDFYDALKQLYSEFKNYEQKLAKNLKLEEEKLSDFFNSFLDIKGTLFENDFITQTLTSVLNNLKSEGKKNVLIIDDFDRIDPEHIFRILNILSVHNNYYATENKFAFDHVIIVCDIENIKKVFYHRYGAGVDFDGYIDKFYSTDLFFYSNNNALRFYINEIFRADNNNLSNIDFMISIFQGLVDVGSLSIRRLLKHKYDISFNKFILHESKSEDFFYLPSPSFIAGNTRLYIDSNDLAILKFFKLMSFVYGDFNIFFQDLKKISSKEKFSYDQFQDLIHFLVLQFHIASIEGKDHFYTKRIEKVSRQILGLDYPEVNTLGNNFRIQPKWYAGNPYVSAESFFKDASVSMINRDRIIYNNQEQEISFEFSSIVNLTERIIIECSANGFLNLAGIHFNEK